MRKYTQLCTILPEIEKDGLKLQHFQLTEKEVSWERTRNSREYWLVAGLKFNYTYTKLIYDNELWMSDTPMEQNTNREFLNNANGDVLVYGLGIGLIIFPLLNDPEIKSITVVELDKRVIDFILPSIKLQDTENKLTVIQGDADIYYQQFEKNRKFDTIYFDIWPSITTDNYEHIKTLERKHRKFINRQNPNFFINSWMKEYLARIIKREKSYSYGFY